MIFLYIKKKQIYKRIKESKTKMLVLFIKLKRLIIKLFEVYIRGILNMSEKMYLMNVELESHVE